MSELATQYIPNHYITMFNRNFGFDTQQMVSRLKSYVTIEADEIPGGGKRYDDLSKRANLEQMPATRAGATRRRQSDSRLRWLTVEPYDDAEVVGKFDQALLGRITNPASDIARSIDAARNRTVDKLILTGVTAEVYTGGKFSPTSTTPFPSAQIIAADFKYDTDGYSETTAAGDLPLTVDKLRKALEMLGAAEVLQGGMAGASGEKPVIAMRAKDKNALYANAVVTSKDFGGGTQYTTGVLEGLLGMTFVPTEQLATDSTTADVLVWMPSGIYFKEQNWETYLDVLPGESHGLQYRIVGQWGVMRRYDERVIVIKVKK